MNEHEAWRLLGTPRFGGILVVSDHASNRVPDDVDLGIDPALLSQHIAVDIGVAAVGAIMAQRRGIARFKPGSAASSVIATARNTRPQ